MHATPPTIDDIAYCLYPPLRLHTHIYHVHISFSFHSLISNACHSLLRRARGSNIFIQIMVTFLSYISNACHSLSGVAERLQHTHHRSHLRTVRSNNNVSNNNGMHPSVISNPLVQTADSVSQSDAVGPCTHTPTHRNHSYSGLGRL